MTIRYPLWKHLLILTVVLFGFYYAAPNPYSPEPSLHISVPSSVAPHHPARVTERTSDR